MILDRYILIKLLLICFMFCCNKQLIISKVKPSAFYQKNEKIWVKSDSIPLLHYSALIGDFGQVKNLLESGIDAMSLDNNGETALMYACKADSIDFKLMSVLIDEGCDILYESKQNFNSAILYSILNSEYCLLQFLLNKLTTNQAEELSSDNYFLGLSITAVEPKIVEKLIPYQKDLNSCDLMGRSFLESAIYQAVIVDGLSSSSRDWEGKEKVDNNAAIEVINLLLSNGADINENSRFSTNVISALNSPTVFSILIEKGLDLSKPVVKYGATNEINTFKILDLFISEISAGTPLDIQGKDVDITKTSKYKLYLNVLDLMIEKGAKSDAKGLSPYEQLLVKAVSENNLKLVRLILDKKKAKINVIDLEGKTLLMRAKEIQSQDMIELLVKNGAS